MLDCSRRSLNWLLPKAESTCSCSRPSELVGGKCSRELSLASPSILFFDLSTLFSFSISFIFSQLFFSFLCLLSVSLYPCLFFPFPFQLYSLSLSLISLSLSFLLFLAIPQTCLVLVFVPPHLLPPACSAAVVGSRFLSGSPAKIAAKDGLP